MRATRLTFLTALSLALPASYFATPLPDLLSHLLARDVDRSEWTLTTDTLGTSAFQAEPYVANGYIGARLPVEGVGYRRYEPNNRTGHDGTNGWPLFDDRFTASMVAGFYDVQDKTEGTNFAQNGGEQVISTLPTWSSLFISLNSSSSTDGNTEATYGVGVDAQTISNFSQSLSLRDGTVHTSLTWSPASGNDTGSSNASGVQVAYTVLAHRKRPTLGLVRLDLSGLEPGQRVILSDVLDGAGALRVEGEQAGVLNASEAKDAIYSTLRPSGISNVTAWEISALTVLPSKSGEALTEVELPASVRDMINATSPATASRAYALRASSSGELSVFKSVGIASSDAFPSTERSVALQSAISARSQGWDALVKEHKDEWESIWDKGGEIIIHANLTGPGSSLQKTSRASLFHLLANVREGSEGHGLGDNSIAPSGLTSDSYAGGIFWDAETWMYPPLLSLFPSFAESINNYRSRDLGAARANAAQYNRSGLLYPWVSFRYANCTGIGPCYDYEYHLNNDIALAQWQYYQATRNQTWLERKGWPILKAVSEFWASQVVRDEGSGRYSANNVTSPDEYSNFRNNSAFTNAGIAVTIRNAIHAASILGKTAEVASNWSDIAANITILKAPSDIILEYDGFNASTPVKQADVVLLTYPLEYETPDPLADLDFYSGVTSPNGPGMTYSIFSVDAAVLATSGCEAYTYLLAGSEPYLRGPFAQFSEQTSDVYAQNGGTNPAYTFLTGHGGYLQSWTHGFTGYRSRLHAFYLDPSLPPQLAPEGFTVKGMKWQGSTFDVSVQGKHTRVHHRAGSGSARVEVGQRNAKAGNYTLAVGDSLVIPTRRTDQNGTSIAGNLAQCVHATSNNTVVPGQYALAAVDGSNATTWRPSNTNATSLTLDLGEPRDVNKLHINWGINPARTFSLELGTDEREMKVVQTMQMVQVNAPYDAASAADVRIKMGNTTEVAVPNGRDKTRFVRLVIEGAQVEDELGRGATVAEVAVF